MSQLQKNSASRGIVDRAVVNIVTGRAFVDAEMIVVRGVENGFVVLVRLRASPHRQDVVRRERAHLAGNMRFQSHPQLHRPKIPRLCPFEQLVKVQPCHSNELLRHFLLNPRRRLQLRRAALLQVGLLVSP